MKQMFLYHILIEQTQKGDDGKLEDTDYQNMTEGELNEIIAYAAGMLQCIHEEINNMYSFLLIVSAARICVLLATLTVILLHK